MLLNAINSCLCLLSLYYLEICNILMIYSCLVAGKLLLMLQAVKRSYAIDKKNTRVHENLVKFLHTGANHSLFLTIIALLSTKPFIGDADGPIESIHAVNHLSNVLLRTVLFKRCLTKFWQSRPCHFFHSVHPSSCWVSSPYFAQHYLIFHPILSCV